MTEPAHEIDFLPIEYRQQHARRKAQPWRIAAVVAFAALLGAAVYGHHRRRAALNEELAAIAPRYDWAVQQNAKLTQAKARLQSARNDAELLTYLRHPWPRTQILAALLASLPDSVTIRQLNLARESPAGAPGSTAEPSRSQREAEEQANQTLSPVQRDLKRLRQQCDNAQVVVVLTGTTTESVSLNDYLGKLNDSKLFAKAEIDSIETAEKAATGQSPGWQFRARLTVRPGYGQPSGPSGPEIAKATAKP